MLHGLAISLLESTLVQSPLRLSACAHMHIHTRMRAGSDARLAAARGSGRYSRWTRYQHGCGSYRRTAAARGVGSDSDFQFPSVGEARMTSLVDVPDRVLVCTACGKCSTFTIASPFIDGRKSVPSRAHANMRASIGPPEKVRSRNSLPRRTIALGHSPRLCAGLRTHRRPRLSMVENRSRRAPAPIRVQNPRGP